jgi:ABC-type branched-subunit amino acid transport system substrate-binding protein
MMGRGVAGIRVLAVALVAMVWVGCSVIGGGLGGPSDAERRDWERVAVQLDSDPESARAALEAFVATWPGGAFEPDARLRLGDLALADGATEAALVHWYRITRFAPRSPVADAARVRVADVEWRLGNMEEAQNALSRVDFERLGPLDRRNAYRMAAGVASDPADQVRWLVLYRAELEDPAELDAADDAIDAALSAVEDGDLERLAGRLGDDPTVARVWLVSAERALDADDLDAASDALEKVRVMPLSPRYATRLSGAVELQLRTRGASDIAALPTFSEAAAAPMPVTEGAVGSIGVVLPLTGRYARFGEESLYGVLLAAGIFDADAGSLDVNTPAPLRVVVRDSAGDPARAAAGVRELAEDERVSAIVGPLVSAECEAAAGAAEEAGIPLLTLTSRDQIAALRPFVFRVRTRPVEETQLLVEKARALGAERFAILYRKDPYGRGLRGLFWDAVEAKGGRVVSVAGYDPDATDFSDPIRRLVGYELLDGEQRKLLGERKEMLRRAKKLPVDEARALRVEARELVTRDGGPLPPIVDFDALFIADSFENVVLITPQLAFEEATGARLLGPEGWYDPDLVRIGREHVEGAIFAAHYFPESEVSFVRDFADRYDRTFLRRSNVFAAQAFDATNLVLVQLARGFESRRAVRDGVLATEAYPGVAGVLSVGADGNAQKRPYLLGVERGRIVQHD